MGIFYGAFILSCFAAAIHDFLFYRIPNAIVFFLVALFLMKVIFFQSFSDIYFPLIVFLLSVSGGFALYAFKIIGAGDAKFLAATSMWASEVNLLGFLFVTSLAGGVLGFICMTQGTRLDALRGRVTSMLRGTLGEDIFNKTFAMNWLSPSSNDKATVSAQKVIPYGIAIFLGCLTLILL